MKITPLFAMIGVVDDISERERERDKRGFCLASSLARSPLQLRASHAVGQVDPLRVRQT